MFACKYNLPQANEPTRDVPLWVELGFTDGSTNIHSYKTGVGYEGQVWLSVRAAAHSLARVGISDPMSKWRWAGFQEGERASTHARLTLGSTPAACVTRGVPNRTQRHGDWSLTRFGPDLAQG